MYSQHEIQIRVRYSETDAMGFLHHANYFSYFEIGRTELLRAQGGNYRELEDHGSSFVVTRLNCNYHKPARYDDLLRLRTTLSKLGLAKIEHDYELFRDEELLATAHSVLACVDRKGNVQRISDVFPTRDPHRQD